MQSISTSRFNNIGAKLFGAFILAFGLVLIALLLMVSGLSRISTTARSFDRGDVVLESSAKTIDQSTVLIQSLVFPGGMASMTMPQDVVKRAIKTVDKAVAKATAVKNSDATADLRHRFQAIAALWKTNRADINKLIVDVQKGDLDNASDLMQKRIAANWKKMRADIEKVGTEVEQVKQRDLDNMTSSATAVSRRGVAVVVAAVLLGGGLLLWVILRLVKQLRGVTQMMDAIADGDGDLTRRLPSGGRDELGRLAAAFNRFVDKMQGLIVEVATATEQVTGAAQQMLTTSEETSAHLQAQQSETEQVAAAINEMSASVQEVARNAGQAARVASDTDHEAVAGKQVVQGTIESIESLATSLEGAAQVIGEVDGYSGEIGRILDVIRGIAEQTNLLALNAAIEAARAGEEGRGFAVVAEEVRRLAQGTQKSTHEIQAMIDRLQNGATAAVEVMEKSRTQASESVEQAGRAGASLETIVEAISRINEMNDLIASASEQQSTVAEEINRNVTTIGTITDRTAEGAAQSAGASETLTRLAQELQTRVAQFQV